MKIGQLVVRSIHIRWLAKCESAFTTENRLYLVANLLRV